MSQHMSLALAGQPTIQLHMPSAEPNALQRALGFTKKIYRNPKRGRKPARRAPKAALELTCAPVPTGPTYEIIDGVDERLLPWKFD